MAFPPKDKSGRPGRPAAPKGASRGGPRGPAASDRTPADGKNFGDKSSAGRGRRGRQRDDTAGEWVTTGKISGERTAADRNRKPRDRSEPQEAPRSGKPYGERTSSAPARVATPRSKDAPAAKPYGARPSAGTGSTPRSVQPRGYAGVAPDRRGTPGNLSVGSRRSDGPFGGRAAAGAPIVHAGQRPPRVPAAGKAPVVHKPSELGEGDRIAKLLARAGVASRREVERLISEGRVKLNGEVITTPATVLTSLRGVSVDDTLVGPAAATRLFRFHKPEGLITAERDPAGRPTIYNALINALPPGTPRVMPVGRLDLSTEGLLLLTNDGELKRAMELPATGVPRTYRARTFGDISQPRLEELMAGIEIEGVRYGPINANMERRTGRNQWIEMTLTEGKNREVRRVLEFIGLQVSRLIRTAYGPFELADLPRGAAEEIPQVMVERFRKSLKA